MLGFLILPQIKPAESNTTANGWEPEEEAYEDERYEYDETVDAGCRS